MRSPKFVRILFVLLISILALATANQFFADQVVLNPAFITGSLQMGSKVINQAYLSASSGSNNSSTSVSPPNSSTTSVSYNLTVNVPQNTTLDYTVYASMYTNNYRTYLYWPSATVNV